MTAVSLTPNQKAWVASGVMVLPVFGFVGLAKALAPAEAPHDGMSTREYCQFRAELEVPLAQQGVFDDCMAWYQRNPGQAYP